MKREGEAMYENLLPLGSVVLLEGAEKRLMIIGRIQANVDNGEIFDYSGCYYPEGLMGDESLFFFNDDAISSVFFIGFQDQEELQFRQEVLGKLGNLRVVDGQIVSD